MKEIKCIMVVYRQNTKIWPAYWLHFLSPETKTSIYRRPDFSVCTEGGQIDIHYLHYSIFPFPVLVWWQCECERQCRLTSPGKAISIIVPYTLDARRGVYKMIVFHSVKQPPWHYNLIREHCLKNILEDSAAASSMITSINKLRAIRSVWYFE